MRNINHPFILLAAASLMASCIPYRVGTTAQTVEPGEIEANAAVTYIPDGLGISAADGSEAESTFGMMGLEARYGLDERSDIGLRLIGFTGLVATYKRRFRGGNDDGPALAYMAGAGIVNLVNHAHIEFSLIASGSEQSRVTPYGGLRAMKVFPLLENAVSDDPSIGAFAGARVGNAELWASPEFGFFYDPSALGVRETDFIFVPSITFHGNVLEVLFSDA